MTLEELKAMHTLGTWTQGVEKGDHEDYNVECDGDVLMCGMQSTDAVEEVIALHNYFPALIRIIEAQREALKMVTLVAANQPDENLMDATGPRDAKHRGIMVCNARDIAREALTLADNPLEATT